MLEGSALAERLAIIPNQLSAASTTRLRLPAFHANPRFCLADEPPAISMLQPAARLDLMFELNRERGATCCW